MSGSDWAKFAKVIGFACAAFLIVALVHAVGFYTGNESGYYQGQAERSTAQYPSDTQRIVDGCFKLPTRADKVKCIDEATKAAHENQRAEKDLTAQQEMEDWAWWVMVLGILQFLATIITLGFVKLTLDATLAAVKGTNVAAKAAQDANAIAREVGEAQVRAYLRIELVKTCVTTDLSGKKKAQITLVYVNTGNSTAYDVRIAYKVEFGHKGDVITVIDDMDKIGTTNNPITQIFPNEQTGTEIVSFIDRPKGMLLRFIYKIEWKDIFGRTNHTPAFSGTIAKGAGDAQTIIFNADPIIRKERE